MEKRQTTRSPRVLMLLSSNCFDPDPRVYAEARALVEHGYRVLILAWDRDRKRPVKETIDGIDVERIYLRSTHGRGPTQAFYLLVVLAVFICKGLFREFDVVHAHDFDALPAGLVLAGLRRKPLVYDSHEEYASMVHGNIPVWMERFIRSVESWMLRFVDLLITVGEKLRADFERRGARRTVVVGNWKKLEEYRSDEETRLRVRAELSVPREALLIGYIANLGAERHVPELLEVVAERPNIHAVIGGDGQVAEHVREQARLHPNIHFLGFVNHKRIARYTIAADVIYYGFDVKHPNAQFSAPNKLFEALATGRPVISAEFGEIGRIIRENDCGILLKDFTKQNISRALDLCLEPGRLEHWKQRAGEIGETEYNWARAEEYLIKAYEGILQNGASEFSTASAEAKRVPIP